MPQEILLPTDSPALGTYDSEGAIERRPSVDVFGNPISRILTTLRIKGTPYFVALPANCGEIMVSVGTKSPTPGFLKKADDNADKG